jgi:glycosyltransferase involved in cell wall biosynthesis
MRRPVALVRRFRFALPEPSNPMAHIAYLLTIQPWNERRLFLRQAFALASAGHTISFFCVDPDLNYKVPEGFNFVPIQLRDRKLARRTGSLNLRRRVAALKPDVVVTTCVEQLPLGLWLKSRTSIRVVFDSREDHASAFREHKTHIPRLIRPFLTAVVSYLERAAQRRFDGIVVSDPAIRAMYASVPDERIMVFLNVPQKSLFHGPFQELTERPYDLALVGGMTPRNGMDYLIEAIGRLKTERGKRLTLLLVGRPFDRETSAAVDPVVERYDLQEQIIHAGYFDHDKIPAVMAQARIGMAPHRNYLKFRRNIACKCFEYMACGMPVVCTDLPPQRLFIEERKNGRFFPPEDVEALMNLLEELIDDPAQAAALGRQGRSDFETRWNCEREAEHLVEFFNRVLGRPSR